MSKYFSLEILNKMWKRLTASKIAWMSVPTGLAMMLKPLIDQDISAQLEMVFGGLWMILSVYLATNDPTDPTNF